MREVWGQRKDEERERWAARALRERPDRCSIRLWMSTQSDQDQIYDLPLPYTGLESTSVPASTAHGHARRMARRSDGMCVPMVLLTGSRIVKRPNM